MKRNAPWQIQQGFTLIELVVVMAVVALLATVAAPSFANLIAGQRVRSLASEFHLALTQTRSEAIKRNVNVSLSATNGNWAAGWTILDPDNPTGTPLYTRTTRNASSVTVSATATTVEYTAAGRINASTSPSFVFSAANTSEVRCVSVDPSGRPYTNKASSC
jgi:type IV fimbrial biogenesis protein FimT